MSSPKANDKRRRFQPPITTFFSTTTSPADSPDVYPSYLSNSHYSAATHSLTPVVPPKVQASLLSVGMRVRKSVAEGYKTKMVKVQEEKPQPPITLPSQATQNTRMPSTAYSSIARSELAPFCGMTKSGESCYGVLQSRPRPYFSATVGLDRHLLSTDDAETSSIPPSSQESVESSFRNTVQKRAYNFDEDDDEDEEELYEENAFRGSHLWQSSSCLNSIAPVPRRAASHMAGRTILSPKLGGRHRSIHSVDKTKSMDIDGFEEPLFLRRREEVDTDFEVQMGGT